VSYIMNKHCSGAPDAAPTRAARASFTKAPRSWRKLRLCASAAGLLFGAGACDDEPSWTWAKWVQHDAGPQVKPSAGGASGAQAAGRSHGGALDASAADAVDSGIADDAADASDDAGTAR